MIRTYVALIASLAIWATASSAQTDVADGPKDGVLKIVSGYNNSTCTGYTFGGTIVLTVPSCVFDEGTSRPRERINVIAGMHNHGRIDGRNPKPLDRYFVDRIHMDPDLYRQLQSGGYDSDGPGSKTIVFLNIRTHPGAPDFDDNTRGINALLAGDVYEMESSIRSDSIRSSSFALFGYSSDIRSNAVITSRCSTLYGRFKLLAADCDAALGMIGAPLIDLNTNQAMGILIGRFGDGKSSFLPFPDYLRDDIAAMLAGQKGGFFELRTLEVRPDYFFGVDVWNKCRDVVNVVVHFKDIDTDNWTTLGAYPVRPGELRILPVETKNRNVYWTAFSDGADYYGWRGEQEVRYDGTTLEMIEVNAGPNWNDVRLQPSCSSG